MRWIVGMCPYIDLWADADILSMGLWRLEKDTSIAEKGGRRPAVRRQRSGSRRQQPMQQHGPAESYAPRFAALRFGAGADRAALDAALDLAEHRSHRKPDHGTACCIPRARSFRAGPQPQATRA